MIIFNLFFFFFFFNSFFFFFFFFYRSISVLSMAQNFPAPVLCFLLISEVFVNSAIQELDISNNNNEKIIFSLAKFLRGLKKKKKKKKKKKNTFF